ncbi:TfoX/Sxy family protein [Mucilaginibacter jinjuensis]|uniref:TfoX/Sxy family protein n=1 Tax=Mucilaginibacter jinjuensis TaxID=1176721 RepID=A0ABY7T5N9_9SPHI|nr:TfoX/Sxy family protein [Mucilaginibacter jinjuensis]WCT11774.1 TfoX/Sxy family protein [Mucilaginibacter jinjuensis]
MPYDEYLAERLRNALSRAPNVVEQKHMGGITFLVNDVLCTRAHRSGSIMQRCLPELTDELCQKPGVKAMEMKGKDLKGWLLISPEAVDSEDDFDFWMKVALDAAKVATPAKRRVKK